MQSDWGKPNFRAFMLMLFNHSNVIKRFSTEILCVFVSPAIMFGCFIFDLFVFYSIFFLHTNPIFTRWFATTTSQKFWNDFNCNDGKKNSASFYMVNKLNIYCGIAFILVCNAWKRFHWGSFPWHSRCFQIYFESMDFIAGGFQLICISLVEWKKNGSKETETMNRVVVRGGWAAAAAGQ